VLLCRASCSPSSPPWRAAGPRWVPSGPRRARAHTPGHAGLVTHVLWRGSEVTVTVGRAMQACMPADAVLNSKLQPAPPLLRPVLDALQLLRRQEEGLSTSPASRRGRARPAGLGPCCPDTAARSRAPLRLPHRSWRLRGGRWRAAAESNGWRASLVKDGSSMAAACRSLLSRQVALSLTRGRAAAAGPKGRRQQQQRQDRRHGRQRKCEGVVAAGQCQGQGGH